MRTPLVATAIFLTALALAACKFAPPTKPYAYPAWGFTASFPTAPKETKQPGSPDGSTPSADRVESSADGRQYAVWAADVSRTGMSLDDLAKAASGYIAKQMGASAGVPTYVATSDGVMGREYRMTRGGKWLATLRVFLVGGRFYEVIGKSALGEDDPAVKDFLVSFRTLGGPAVAGNTAK
jgi:hypothetical protein